MYVYVSVCQKRVVVHGGQKQLVDLEFHSVRWCWEMTPCPLQQKL